MLKNFMMQNSFYIIKKKFDTQTKCLKYLEKLRWGNQPVCIFCNAQNITKRKNTIKYHCNKCNRDFSVLQGTIFENTHLKLTKWFRVILLMLYNGTELNTLQISKKINVSYKTTWYTVARIRSALKARADTAPDKLSELHQKTAQPCCTGKSTHFDFPDSDKNVFRNILLKTIYKQV